MRFSAFFILGWQAMNLDCFFSRSFSSLILFVDFSKVFASSRLLNAIFFRHLLFAALLVFHCLALKNRAYSQFLQFVIIYFYNVQWCVNYFLPFFTSFFRSIVIRCAFIILFYVLFIDVKNVVREYFNSITQALWLWLHVIWFRLCVYVLTKKFFFICVVIV